MFDILRKILYKMTFQRIERCFKEYRLLLQSFKDYLYTPNLKFEEYEINHLLGIIKDEKKEIDKLVEHELNVEPMSEYSCRQWKYVYQIDIQLTEIMAALEKWNAPKRSIF